MDRRFETGSDAAPEAAGLAARQVATWVASDGPVYECARDILAGVEAYAPRTPGGDVTERLAAFVEMLLYTDDGSTYRSMYERVRGGPTGFDSRLPGQVRTHFTRADFDGIDWKAVADELTTA